MMVQAENPHLNQILFFELKDLVCLLISISILDAISADASLRLGRNSLMASLILYAVVEYLTVRAPLISELEFIIGTEMAV